MPRVFVSPMRRRWRARDAINVGECGARLHVCADFDVYFLCEAHTFGVCEEFHSPQRHKGHKEVQERAVFSFRKRGSGGGSPRAALAFPAPAPRHASQTPFHPANVPIRAFIGVHTGGILLSSRAILLLNRGIGLPNRATALSNRGIALLTRAIERLNGGIELLNGGIGRSNGGMAASNRGKE